MKLVAVFGLLGTLALAGVSFADGQAPSPNDPDLVRLQPANGHSLKWNYVPSGKSDRYGHAGWKLNRDLTNTTHELIPFLSVSTGIT